MESKGHGPVTANQLRRPQKAPPSHQRGCPAPLLEGGWSPGLRGAELWAPGRSETWKKRSKCESLPQKVKQDVVMSLGKIVTQAGNPRKTDDLIRDLVISLWKTMILKGYGGDVSWDSPVTCHDQPSRPLQGTKSSSLLLLTWFRLTTVQPTASTERKGVRSGWIRRKREIKGTLGESNMACWQVRDLVRWFSYCNHMNPPFLVDFQVPRLITGGYAENIWEYCEHNLGKGWKKTTEEARLKNKDVALARVNFTGFTLW